MIHVFVGPTLSAEQVLAIHGDAHLLPPVVHGDLLRLDAGANDVVVIIDGGYHHCASVRHKEILHLLAEGVTVVGCSSMGALRAAELEPYGMVGNGAVFELYREGALEADDEVAVAHGEGPEYLPFSEPLVNIRYGLAQARRAGVVSETEEAAIVECARSMSYTDRSWRSISSELERGRPPLHTSVLRVRAFLDENAWYSNIKAADAVDTLTRLEPITAGRKPLSKPWIHRTDWRTRHLYEWTANFAGSRCDDVWVEFGSVIRYRQIYDAAFPRRWRRFALGRIGRTRCSYDHEPTDAELLAGAVAVAGEMGLDGESLTNSHLDEWALDAERELSAAQLLGVVLVRSYRPPNGVYDLLTGEPELARDTETTRAVAESYVVNTTIEGWAPNQSVNHIKEPVLRRHLADVWALSPDDTKRLTAAAWDRGFASVADAVTSVRPFYLGHHVRSALE